MPNDLMNFDFTQVPSMIEDTASFNDLSQGADFLRRIQLVGKGKYVDKRVCQPGTFVVPIDDDKAQVLGEKIDVLVLAYRAKALDMNDSPPVSLYNPKDPEFNKIRALADTKDSGCMAGNEFLVVERTTGEAFTLFFGTKTHRPESRKIAVFLPVSPATIAKLVEEGKIQEGDLTAQEPQTCSIACRYCQNKAKGYSWYVPEISRCSLQVRLPDNYLDLIRNFKNPPARVHEKNADAEKANGRVR